MEPFIVILQPGTCYMQQNDHRLRQLAEQQTQIVQQQNVQGITSVFLSNPQPYRDTFTTTGAVNPTLFDGDLSPKADSNSIQSYARAREVTERFVLPASRVTNEGHLQNLDSTIDSAANCSIKVEPHIDGDNTDVPLYGQKDLDRNTELDIQQMKIQWRPVQKQEVTPHTNVAILATVPSLQETTKIATDSEPSMFPDPLQCAFAAQEINFQNTNSGPQMLIESHMSSSVSPVDRADGIQIKTELESDNESEMTRDVEPYMHSVPIAAQDVHQTSDAKASIVVPKADKTDGKRRIIFNLEEDQNMNGDTHTQKGPQSKKRGRPRKNAQKVIVEPQIKPNNVTPHVKHSTRTDKQPGKSRQNAQVEKRDLPSPKARSLETQSELSRNNVSKYIKKVFNKGKKVSKQTTKKEILNKKSETGGRPRKASKHQSKRTELTKKENQEGKNTQRVSHLHQRQVKYTKNAKDETQRKEKGKRRPQVVKDLKVRKTKYHTSLRRSQRKKGKSQGVMPVNESCGMKTEETKSQGEEEGRKDHWVRRSSRNRNIKSLTMPFKTNSVNDCVDTQDPFSDVVVPDDANCKRSQQVEDETKSTVKHSTCKRDNMKLSTKTLTQTTKQCEICLRSFSSSQKILRHAKRYHFGLKKGKSFINCGQMQKCKCCTYTHKNLYKMFLHMKSQHNWTFDKFCEDARQRLHVQGIEKVKRVNPAVLRTHHNSTLCDICGKSFSKVNLMQQHRYSVHSTKSFACKLCDKVYSTCNSLTRHLRLFHGKSKKPLKRYECLECNKVFLTYSSKKFHMDSTHGEPLKCNLCSKTYRYKSSLEIHMREHCGDFKFNCSLCMSCFVSKRHLYNHLAKVHNQGKYHCDKCGKGFSDMYNLKVHMNKHTKEKPHKCPECGKGFGDPGNLIKHKLTHLEDKPFKCSVCNKGYAQKHVMMLHEKKHPQNDSLNLS